MPNWCENNVTFRGKKEDVIKMFESVGCKFNNKTFESDKPITMRSFIPMPQTFEDYDTTNRKKDVREFGSVEEYEKYSKEYDDAVRYQKETYGCVGWYDYNIKTLGTKWDSELNGLCSSTHGDEMIVYCNIDTAWDAPIEWVREMSRKYSGINIELEGIEPGAGFCVHIECEDGEDFDFERTEYNDEDYSDEDEFDEHE